MNYKGWLKRVLKLLLIITIFCSEFQTVNQVFASELTFYNHNTKSNVKYTGKQISYICNNKIIDLSYPGIILSGTALVDYEELFVKELGLTAKIDNKKIIFTNETTELVLTLGSKTVKLNGKSQTMSVAPVKLEFKDGTIKYYVPTRFVAETFGYNYVYNSKTSEAKITETLRLSINEKTILYSDTLYSVYYKKQLLPLDKKIISYKNTVYAPANLLFNALDCEYKEENGQLTVSKDDILLQMKADSCNISVNDVPFHMETAPISLAIGKDSEPKMYIPLEYVLKTLGFSTNFNEKECRYYIKDTEYTGNPELHPDLKAYFTTNIIESDQEPIDTYFLWEPEETINIQGKKELTKVRAYSIENADVLELYGITKSDINDFMDNSSIVFELKSVISNLDTKFFNDLSVPHLKYILLTTLNNTTKIFIMAPYEDEWFIEETEECIKVYFMSANSSLDDIKTFDEVSNDQNYKNQEIKYPENKLIVPVPEGFETSLIKIQDNYLDKNIRLILPGNLLDYYKKNVPVNPYDFIKNIEVLYDKETNQTTINLQTGFICGYEEEIHDKFFALKLGKPSEIYDKIMVLDAGHGGKDPGALRDNILEKNITLNVVNFTEEIFKNSDIKVYCTRIKDKYLTLQERTKFVKEVDADIFVSVHINASELEDARGTEVYYYKGNNAATEYGLTSNKMAKVLANNLYVAMDTKLRGVLNNDYYVIHYNSVPAVLIELGFISNNEERAKLNDKTYQKKAANAIYESIIEIFSAYPTGR